jgi:hypothetical protein
MNKEKIEKAKEYGLTYERLFEIAYKLHLQIFLLTGDEKSVYDEIGLTDEENALLGYGYLELKEGNNK